jgi:drug/metabolite transporter (DMT)-like permease
MFRGRFSVMTRVSRRAKVWIALWTVYIIWGSTYLGIELAGETMPGLFAAGARFSIAGLLMLGFIAWRRGTRALRATKGELLSAAVVGLLLPGANSLLFITEQHVPIGLTSLIIAAVPLWVLLMRVVARDRPDVVSSIGLVVGFGGIALLVKPGGGSGSLGYLLLTVTASFMWALGSFLAPRIPVPRDALVATGYEMFAGGLVLVGVVVADPSKLDPMSWSGRSLGGFVYLVLIGSIVGYTAYAWLLANAPITQVSTYAYVNPVVAIALGVIVLDESLTLRIVAGAVLILVSVAIVLRREARVAAQLEPGEVVRPDGHAGELAPARRS